MTQSAGVLASVKISTLTSEHETLGLVACVGAQHLAVVHRRVADEDLRGIRRQDVLQRRLHPRPRTGVWSGAIAMTGTAPSGRSGPTAASWLDATSGAWQMTIFGGSGSGTFYSDVFTLDLGTGVWSAAITMTETVPSGRSGRTAVSWLDATSGARQMTIVAGEIRFAALER